MAEGGTLKSKLEAIDKKLDAESKRWQDAQLPGPGPMYRMNNDEFLHHCHVLAIAKILETRLSIPNDEMTLVLKEVYLDEAEKMFDAAMEAKSNALRDALTQGVNIIGPNGHPFKPEI